MGDPLPTDTRLEPFAILKMALDTLAQRVYRWVVLAMSFSLFAYAMVKIDPWRILAASVFTLLILVPLAWAERKRR